MEYGIVGLVIFSLIAAGIFFFHKKHESKKTFSLKMRLGSDVKSVHSHSVEPGMAVVLTFSEILIKHNEWETPFSKMLSPAREINLLDGTPILAQMGEDTILPGRYEWVRLGIVPEKCFVIQDGQSFPLSISTDAQDGLMLVRSFWVHGLGRSDFTIDFNLRTNLSRKADGTYILNPALMMIDNTDREEDVPGGSRNRP